MSGDTAPSGYRCRSRDEGRICIISAARASRGDMARHVLGEVRALLDIPPSLAVRLETALHEAIANVTLHGALETPGFERTGLASLQSQQKLLSERLADPRYSAREIEVGIKATSDRLDIEITGPGPGFDFSHVSHLSLPEARTRGLSLIARMSDDVTYRNGGRTVSLSFFLGDDAPAKAVPPEPSREEQA